MRWRLVAVCLVAGTIALSGSWAAAAQEVSDTSAPTNLGPIVTLDHAVPHRSTVPANAPEIVSLFVREVYPENRDLRKAVLMVHGASVPGLAGFDLATFDGGRGHYSWARWLAQSGGFDVFVLEFQGSGLSPRPEMADPCNVPEAQQRSILIPNPLAATCAPSYPFQLINSQSDWSELDTVVDFIRSLRGVDKVALVSWSQGSLRVGPYAVQHPEKVDSLLLFAPIYNPLAPAGSGDGFAPPLDPATGLPVPLPRPGTPMTLRTRTALIANGWGPEIRCEDQVQDRVQDAVWTAIMNSDPLGRTWGPPPARAPAGSPPEGVMRVRSPFLWGWNAGTAARVPVPVLIIYGESDATAPPTFDQLYAMLPNPNKLLFKVQCAGHYMVWESQRKVLHHVSSQWLMHGVVEGFTTGRFFIDTEGNLSPMGDPS